MDRNYLQVGDISDSQAVALGAGAQATINQYTEIIVRLDNIEEASSVLGCRQTGQPTRRCQLLLINNQNERHYHVYR
jgi:hypothetical protein